MSQEKTPWQKYKEKIGKSRPWDLFDSKTVYVSKDVYESRIEICRLCPKLISGINVCSECGCLMPIKAKMEHAHCPIRKW
jgi:hypothetical protein